MTHKVVDIVQQRFGLGEVAVTEQVDIEVGDRHGVHVRRHGVGREIAGTRGVVKPGRVGMAHLIILILLQKVGRAHPTV